MQEQNVVPRPHSSPCQMLGQDNLYCRYVIEHGGDWNVIEVGADFAEMEILIADPDTGTKRGHFTNGAEIIRAKSSCGLEFSH